MGLNLLKLLKRKKVERGSTTILTTPRDNTIEEMDITSYLRLNTSTRDTLWNLCCTFRLIKICFQTDNNLPDNNNLRKTNIFFVLLLFLFLYLLFIITDYICYLWFYGICHHHFANILQFSITLPFFCFYSLSFRRLSI